MLEDTPSRLDQLFPIDEIVTDDEIDRILLLADQPESLQQTRVKIAAIVAVGAVTAASIDLWRRYRKGLGISEQE